MKWQAGMIVRNWYLVKQADTKKYIVRCTECGFTRVMYKTLFPAIINGKKIIACKECRRLKNKQEAQWKKEMGRVGRNRASGLFYKNSPERLAEIKAKYANGVTMDILTEWLGR